MKKIYSLLVLAGFTFQSYGQLLVEDFTGYNTGLLAGQGGWSKSGSSVAEPSVATASPLTKANYNGGGGNYVDVPGATSSTSNVRKAFTTTTGGTSTFFLSFLINVSTATSTGDYFFSLGDPSAGTNYFARMFAKSSGAGYNLGISKISTTGTYGSTILNFNQTYLVVVRYSYVSGTTNDPVYLWVEPSTAAEPSTASAEATISSGTDGPATVGNAIFHNRSVSNPGYKADGLRVSNGATSAAAWTSLNANLTYYPVTGATNLAAIDNWTSNSDGTAGAQPADFTSLNQVFNVNKNASVTGVWDINGIDVTLTNGAILTLNSGAALNIKNAASDVNFNSNSVVLKSDAAGTASIGQVSGTLSGASNVTVERFIGAPVAKRAWRLLTAPLRSTTTDVSVFDTWQLGGTTGVGGTGKGTLVTGPAANSATNGLDVTSGYGLQTYNGTALAGVDNTKTAPLFTTAPSAANKGYFLFVRGDRSGTDLTYVSQTTLSATGELQTGDQSFATNAAPNGFTLIGNPYASPVDFDAVRTDNAGSNILPTFYYWDPNESGVGHYVTVSYDGTGSSYTITPSAASHTRYIQSGHAIFVQTNSTGSGTPTLTFKESQKSSTVVNNLFRTGTQVEKLYVNLELQNADNSWTLADGTTARFNNSYFTSVGNDDAQKILNFDENIGLLRSGKILSIESRPLIDNSDTLFLTMSNMKLNRTYQFSITPENFDAPLLQAYLEDAYANTSTALSLSAATTVTFTTSNAASVDANRFRIVFKTSGALPVNYTAVKAYQQNAGIQVDWKVATETNLRGYEVEKSNDGRNFTAAATIAARANNNSAVSYSWLDAAPANGLNYYRIKAIDNNGAAKFSQVVNVRIGAGKSEITVYPNPVIGNTLSLQFTNEAKGTYTLNLYNNIGQVVFSKTIAHNGGSATQTINLGNAVSKGVYQLQLSNGEVKLNQQVICN